jgi:hypothetical protein
MAGDLVKAFFKQELGEMHDTFVMKQFGVAIALRRTSHLCEHVNWEEMTEEYRKYPPLMQLCQRPLPPPPPAACVG